MVTFVNKTKKKPPSSHDRRQGQPVKKTGLFDYIVEEQTHEPWNEYVIQDGRNRSLRVRTILTDVSYYDDIVDPMGDPVLETKRIYTTVVTTKASSESGMT